MNSRTQWLFHVLGSRGSRPVCGADYLEFGGGTSCYMVRGGDHAVLLDCGTGLYQAAPLLEGCKRIDILLTHVHYDHLLGLLDFGVFPPNANLRFIAPFHHWFGTDTLRRFLSPPFWPVTPDFCEIITVSGSGQIALSESLLARFHTSRHPDGACIHRVDGPGWSVSYICDYEHGDGFPEDFARNSTVLLYDAMFTDAEYPERVGWGHSSWQEGCTAAKSLGIKNLMFVHHHPARNDAALRALEQEANCVFPGARFARTGDTFDLTGQKPLYL